MVQLQKSIVPIGMFSSFESILQHKLDCKNGFEEEESIKDIGTPKDDSES